MIYLQLTKNQGLYLVIVLDCWFQYGSVSEISKIEMYK